MTAAIITALLITALIVVACTVAIVRALSAPRPVDTAALEATESRLMSVREALAGAVLKMQSLDKDADELARALDEGGMVTDAVDDALKVGFDIDDHFDRYELKSEIEDEVRCELGDKVGEMIRDALQHEIKELIEDMAPSREEFDGVVESVTQLQRHCYPVAAN